jgi:hypothetical protein
MRRIAVDERRHLGRDREGKGVVCHGRGIAAAPRTVQPRPRFRQMSA